MLLLRLLESAFCIMVRGFFHRGGTYRKEHQGDLAGFGDFAGDGLSVCAAGSAGAGVDGIFGSGGTNGDEPAWF